MAPLKKTDHTKGKGKEALKNQCSVTEEENRMNSSINAVASSEMMGESSKRITGESGVQENFSYGLRGEGDSRSESAASISSRIQEGGAVNERDSPDSGLAERFAGVLGRSGEGGRLSTEDDGEKMLQWIQALDLHVVGGCRADERLKPMLKLNYPGAHLIQHLGVSEVAKLARCLCIPLVSVRVGKVIKQGHLLRPTDKRGYLNLNLLPTSDMRLSFAGDDGSQERLAFLHHSDPRHKVVVDEISADTSGRSFLVKSTLFAISYFWISEKSMVTGKELLAKMKDILCRSPSLAEMTGITETRLDLLGSDLRSYLKSVSVSNANGMTLASPYSSATFEPAVAAESSAASGMLSSVGASSRIRQTAPHSVKVHSQGSLSPRTSIGKVLSSNRPGICTREKLKRRTDAQCSLPRTDVLLVSSGPPSFTPSAGSSREVEDGNCKPLKQTLIEYGSQQFPLIGLPDIYPISNISCTSLFPSLSPAENQPSTARIAPLDSVSPYYCWCPPCTTSLHYASMPPSLDSISVDPFTIPPLSSIFSAGCQSTLVQPNHSFDSSSKLAFPAVLPDPLARFPHPVSSFLAISSSQQVPTFAPFVSDPIVHVPVIDVCSAGQGYLVSAGPSMSTTISPLLPKYVDTLIPEPESVLEKGARETLRLLISLSEKQLGYSSISLNVQSDKHSALVTGSRGFYSGCCDIGASSVCRISEGFTGLVSVKASERIVGSSISSSCPGKGNSNDEQQLCFDDDDDGDGDANFATESFTEQRLD